MIRLSIVIPVLDQWTLTEACLQSIAKYTRGKFYEVIVVDNGSTDDTPNHCAAVLGTLFPGRSAYLRREEPLPFGPACNLGADAASGQYILFLNNDTEVLAKWVEPLFRAMQTDDRLGAISPLLLYPDTMRVQHVGVAFDPNLHPVHLFDNFPANHPSVLRMRRLQAISAAALFMPRDLFADCGGFFEGYRNGSEDMDLCCQLQRRGMRVACVPESVVLHHTSRTVGRYDHVSENAKLLNERCRGCFTSDLHRIARREGYEVQLSDWLEPYLVEPGPQQIGNDLETVLEAYPLWESGYVRLVDKLEADGNLTSALAWQDICAGFFPDVAHFRRAMELAEAAGNAAQQTRWHNRMLHVLETMQDVSTLEERARENFAWFQQAGDDDLIRLYHGWLSKHALKKVALPILNTPIA